ncbi:hydantoinase B/oxoprolinase family protein [Pararhodospirillum oryzae]|uniref:N-methylhydantoinase HyuB n=1 Tax=Pararhodospirillum oryzae TaxID=478448 RepID=A0A512HBJ2_9PROT|nr:hydantoinase B/oxoprolinase family protein [Pararhodospirillum oryzae]GEO82827.1 N-methylhydantoinase HyuB [Pararhodospirillum oryzae]
MTPVPTRGPAPGRWAFWIDRGGTFTDIVARDPWGNLHTCKLLSDNPGLYADAALAGIRRLMDLSPGAELPENAIEVIKMGTTVVTNALLERKGARTVLVITRGFADLPSIGDQDRPDLFARAIKLPELLHERVIEARERLTVEGHVLEALDELALRDALQAAFDDGLRTCAISFLHGYLHPVHEQKAAAIAQKIGFTQISVSHRVSPLIRFVGRTDTTIVDATLSPPLRQHIDRLSMALNGTRLLFMQSNGGLVDSGQFQGKDALLSGPAGGVIATARVAAEAGADRVIGFDMGGTSTDVSHYAGALERVFESRVGGVRLRVPMMHINTVAAGGGSVVAFDGTRLTVGPQSAGAMPGPACYRHGGPPTVTDANVVLGRVQPEYFPAVFGPDGDQPLDGEAAVQAFTTLARQMGDSRPIEVIAEAVLDLAVQNMAGAIRTLTVARGHDVTGYALCCFGGAGGQHATLVADALGIGRIVLHPLAGLLSAWGMGLADLRAMNEQSLEIPLDAEAHQALLSVWSRLETKGRQTLALQGAPLDAVRIERRAQIRYGGSDTALEVAAGSIETMTHAFLEQHRRQFGFVLDRPLVIATVIAEAIAPAEDGAAPLGAAPLPSPAPAARAARPVPPPPALAVVGLHAAGVRHPARVYARDALEPGMVIPGPALILETGATTVVDPAWQAGVMPGGILELVRRGARPVRPTVGTGADPLRLALFNARFMAIAEQMGAVLRNTAHSVNIKERLDFSCAVFDPWGALVANAPHVPVHLGSMGESVRAIRAAHLGAMGAGDVFVTNAPYNGGTHLPDLTVVTPYFHRGDILFWVASRGHHADIGGLTPGSMPPDSKTVAEEGILLDAVPLVRGGRFLENETRARLEAGPWPARNPDQNLADLRAQIAANEAGIAELNRLMAEFGPKTVRAYMGHVQDNAEEMIRRALVGLRDGTFETPMDDGSLIRVAVRVDPTARRAVIDFTGTSPQTSGNTNAPLAVTRAAVLYVLRTLVDVPIPLNEGCLKPITLIVPRGCLLNPVAPAAVVAGNVETSQMVVDALYGALGLMAGSQGTMNNITFGDDTVQYYETVCGGGGAGPDHDGASGVHTHMTNSRLTDPEILERRFPVLVDAFTLRRGSGGEGRFRGGDGVIRRLCFRKPMTAAIVSNRRNHPPHGLAGGQPGAAGVNRVERVGGQLEFLPGTTRVTLAAGDTLVVETPGGGGFGLGGDEMDPIA